MDIFERLYFAFRVRPFSTKKVRALKKETKAFLWDWSLVEDLGAKFENLIASHLLKFCHYLEDVEGYDVTLHYLRDLDKREVDFLVCNKGKPWFAAEVKMNDTKVSKHLCYFKERLSIPFSYQVTMDESRNFVQDGIHVLPASQFLTALI